MTPDYEKKFNALSAAVEDLYMAAYWIPDRDVANEKELWEKVRDAADIESGFSPKQLLPKDINDFLYRNLLDKYTDL